MLSTNSSQVMYAPDRTEICQTLKYLFDALKNYFEKDLYEYPDSHDVKFIEKKYGNYVSFSPTDFLENTIYLIPSLKQNSHIPTITKTPMESKFHFLKYSYNKKYLELVIPISNEVKEEEKELTFNYMKNLYFLILLIFASYNSHGRVIKIKLELRDPSLHSVFSENPYIFTNNL